MFFAMFLFGFTTLLADIYYGEVNLLSLFPGKDKIITGCRIICCVLIVIGAVASVPVVWSLVDFASAFMVFFNVIALLLLSKYVAYVLRDYAGQKSKGIDKPFWNTGNDITRMNLQKLSDEQ